MVLFIVPLLLNTGFHVGVKVVEKFVTLLLFTGPLPNTLPCSQVNVPLLFTTLFAVNPLPLISITEPGSKLNGPLPEIPPPVKVALPKTIIVSIPPIVPFAFIEENVRVLPELKFTTPPTLSVRDVPIVYEVSPDWILMVPALLLIVPILIRVIPVVKFIVPLYVPIFPVRL